MVNLNEFTFKRPIGKCTYSSLYMLTINSLREVFGKISFHQSLTKPAAGKKVKTMNSFNNSRGKKKRIFLQFFTVWWWKINASPSRSYVIKHTPIERPFVSAMPHFFAAVLLSSLFIGSNLFGVVVVIVEHNFHVLRLLKYLRFKHRAAWVRRCWRCNCWYCPDICGVCAISVVRAATTDDRGSILLQMILRMRGWCAAGWWLLVMSIWSIGSTILCSGHVINMSKICSLVY